MERDVFISYSEQDKPVADAACATLEQRGIRCWIAPRDVPAGQAWAAALVEAIAASRAFVLILSNGSNTSPQVVREVGEAVDNALPIFPLRIENVEPSEGMRYYIRSIHWLDAMTPPLEEHLDRLAALVEAALEAGSAAPSGEPEVARQPPPGPATPSTPAATPWYRRPLVWGSAAIVVLLATVLAVVLGGSGDGSNDSGDDAAIAADATNAEEPADAGEAANAGDAPLATTSPEPATTSPEPAVPTFEDSFDGELDAGWSWLFEDPEAWSLTGGGLEIIADDNSTNRLVRDAPNAPFELTTLVRFTPTSNFQFAGIIVQGDRWEDWIQFGRAYCDPTIAGCIGDGIYFDNLRDSEFFGVSGNYPYDGGDEVYLRLAADGDRYAGYFSQDGETWTLVGAQTGDGFRRIGLVAHQGHEASAPAEFAFVTIAPVGTDLVP